LKRPAVIIVGAGAAGLAAAKILSDNQVPTLILEARGRIGGRILTVKDPAFPIPVDLGAEFIHGKPDATWDLVHQENLTAYDVPFDHYHRRGQRLEHLSDFSGELGQVMNGLPTGRRPDLSFAQFLRTHRRGPKYANARALAVHFVQGFDAADPQRVSAKSVAQEWQGIGDIEEETQFRLLGGQGTLIDRLHGSLNSKHIAIRLNAIVSEICWKKSKVEINCGRGPRRSTFRAKRLILTLPIGIMQLSPETAGSIRFTPDIAAKRQSALDLGSGPVVKAVLKFRHAFWEDPSIARAVHAKQGLQKAAFLHGFDLPFPTWWTSLPLRLPVLTAWAGGPKARALAGLGRQKLIDAALTSLSTLLNQPRSRLASMLEKIHVHDWLSDPFARGAYSYVTVGAASARAKLAKPIDKTLFFAGEATDTSGQASTVAGALASGQRAAQEVLAAL
jgi:monoamine oxidase